MKQQNIFFSLIILFMLCLLFVAGCGMEDIPTTGYLSGDAARQYAAVGIGKHADSANPEYAVAYYGGTAFSGNDGMYTGSFKSHTDTELSSSVAYTKHGDNTVTLATWKGFESNKIFISAQTADTDKAAIQVDVQYGLYWWYRPDNLTGAFRSVSLGIPEQTAVRAAAMRLSIISDSEMYMSTLSAAGTVSGSLSRGYFLHDARDLTIYGDTLQTYRESFGYIHEDYTTLIQCGIYDTMAGADTTSRIMLAIKEDSFPTLNGGGYDTAITKPYFAVLMESISGAPADLRSSAGELIFADTGGYTYTYDSSETYVRQVDTGTFTLTPDTTGFNLIMTRGSDNARLYGYINRVAGKCILSSLENTAYRAISIAVRR